MKDYQGLAESLIKIKQFKLSELYTNKMM